MNVLFLIVSKIHDIVPKAQSVVSRENLVFSEPAKAPCGTAIFRKDVPRMNFGQTVTS